MKHEDFNEIKHSIGGKVLLLSIGIVFFLIVNTTFNVIIQYTHNRSNVEEMMSSHLDSSEVMVTSGLSYLALAEDTLVTELPPSHIEEILKGTGCDTFMLDKNGDVVASFVKSGSAAESNYSQYVQAPGASLIDVNPRAQKGVRYCYAAKSLSNTDWTVLVRENSSKYYSGIVNAFWLNAGLVVIMAVLLLLMNFIFARKVSIPMRKIKKKIVDMADGNLSGSSLNINADDELGTLAKAVDALAESQQDIINDIFYTADQIAQENLCVKPKAEYSGDYIPIKDSLERIIESVTGVIKNVETAGNELSTSSAQMSSNSAILSRAANEEEQTVHELNESLAGVHKQISRSAEQASKAREMELGSVESINECNEKMSRMLDAMRDINETSSEIANIIKTIQDISFQTNILSLNASIEAARAGAAGKGFAVVAGEVGALASKTAEAAKSTTGLIESSVKSVEHGTVIANETAEMLSVIVEKASKNVKVVDAIADASTKEAEAVSQTLEGMNRISAAVSNIASSATECAASAETLAQQSTMLLATVDKFVIDGKSPNPVSSVLGTPKSPKASTPITPSAPKPAKKITLSDDEPEEQSKTSSKPASAPNAPKQVSAVSKPVSASKPAAQAPKPSAPAPKPSASAPKPAAPASKSAAPAAKPVAASKPAASKPSIKLPDDDDAPIAPAGAVETKATMTPVKYSIHLDSNKY